MLLHDAYERYRFAYPLKNMLRQFHIHDDVWEDRERKEKPIPWLGVSPRYMAQTLGTEWGRECIRPDVWVVLAMGRWHQINAAGKGRMVIPDVRFINEAEWIKENGILLEVKRDDNPHEIDNPDHASEMGIGNVKPHAVVHNDGTKEELRLKAWDIVNDIYSGMAS